MSSKDELTPTTNRNDPWNQNFEDFKNHHQSDRQKIPQSAVFDVQKLQNFISATGATKIAFYPMKHPNPVDPKKEQGLMVAVGFTDSFERIDEEPYLPAEHNCPDDCQTDPLDRIKVRPKPEKASYK